MMPRIEACIDLNAISHNFAQIKSLVAADTEIMPMVKANAYGHGLIDVVNRLPEADAFGVATLPEAFRLRDAGVKQAIFVMCGFRSPDELPLFAELGLTAVVHHLDQVQWLTSASLSKPLSVWLKVDTGMHRLGVSADEFMSAYDSLQQSANIKQPLGLMTHFANADADAAFTQRQLTLFTQLTAGMNNPKSCANSAGILAFDDTHHQLVRPGIMLYGVSPFTHKTGADFGLKPAMRLTSGLVSYKTIKAGEYIGYGCQWRAEQDMQVGIVTAGYGDGYPRHAHNGTPVVINDCLAPIVGRVSMDLLAIDLSNVPHPRIGDRVLLWGESLPAEQVALAADTIAYELFCQLTERVHRSLVA